MKARVLFIFSPIRKEHLITFEIGLILILRNTFSEDFFLLIIVVKDQDPLLR